MNHRNIDPRCRAMHTEWSHSRRRSVLRTPWMLIPAATVFACGPVGGSDGPLDDYYSDDAADGLFGVGGGAIGGPAGGGGYPGVGGHPVFPGTGGGEPATGGAGSSCLVVQPQQTYICNGWGYEDETAGAASLTVITEYCADYGGTGGVGTGGAGVGGGFPATGGVGTGGWLPATGGVGTGGLEGIGGAACTGRACDDEPLRRRGPRDRNDRGVGGEGYGGYPEEGSGGVGVGGTGYGGYPEEGSGGFPSAGGGFGVGGGPSNPTRPTWCSVDGPGVVTGGISFAVGSCQDVDVALPLQFREPHGEYELTIYGSYSACDRAYPITTAAGIGTGQVLEIPFLVQDFTFISVEVKTDPYSDFSVRLRDRPRVVPTGEP